MSSRQTNTSSTKPHLGSPDHYQEGYSAYCLANSWMTENEIPELVRLTLDTAPALQAALDQSLPVSPSCGSGSGARSSAMSAKVLPVSTWIACCPVTCSKRRMITSA